MKKSHILIAGVCAFALAGCEGQPEEAAGDAEATAPALTQLPVSTNAAMVGLIDNSADYLWAIGNGDLPQDEADWDLVRSAAYDMILGGQIMKVPGTGEFDAEWTADPGWQDMSDQLTVIGQDALVLAEEQSTDQEAWLAVGGRLVDNCNGCHAVFKPDIPSDGILHRSTERESRGVSIFD